MPQSRLRATRERNARMLYAFILFYFINLVACIITGMLTDGESISAAFYGLQSGKHTDQFMEFFDGVRSALNNKMYNGNSVSSTPLTILFYRVIGSMIRTSVTSVSDANKWKFQQDQRSMLLYILFFSVAMILISRMVDRKMSHIKSKVFAKIVGFAVMFCFPILYCLEKGNILIITVLFSMFFFFFKDDENVLIKGVSLLFLGVAAGFSIYPLLFTLVLIPQKRFKDILKVLLYTLGLLIFPFILMWAMDREAIVTAAQGCISAVRLLTLAISPFSAKTGVTTLSIHAGTFFSNFGEMFARFTESFSASFTSLDFNSLSICNFAFLPGLRKIFFDSEIAGEYMLIISQLVAILMFFIVKSEWKKSFFLVYLILNFPATSSVYAAAFLIIPFVLFLCDRKNQQWYDWINLAFFSLILTPLPVWWYGHADSIHTWCDTNGITYDIGFNKVLGFILLQCLFLSVLFSDLIVSGIKFTRKNAATHYSVSSLDERNSTPAKNNTDKRTYSVVNIDDIPGKEEHK